MDFTSRRSGPGLPITTRLTIPERPSGLPGSPSPTTPNGRPSKWTVLTVWTLVAAYINTNLQISVLLKIVEHFAQDPSSVPKEESAHKKIAGIAGKELRWARPNSFARAVKCLKSHICAPEFLQRIMASGKELQLKESESAVDNFFCDDGWSYQPPSRKNTNISIMTTDSIGEGINAISQLISNENDPKPADVRSLAKYLYILVKNACFILGSNIHHRAPSESPADQSLDRDGWSNAADAPQDREHPRLTPWDLLSPAIRRDLGGTVPVPLWETVCSGTQDDHKSQQCKCPLNEALRESLWVQKIDDAAETTRLSYILSTAQFPSFADVIDCFGNTALHMLAVYAGSHEHIINVSHNYMREQAKLRNSLGQSFLHLLDEGWLLNEPLLVRLLTPFSLDRHLFYGFDDYCRTFFHVLGQKAGNDSMKQTTLKNVMRHFNVVLIPDCFNYCPSHTEVDVIPEVQITPALEANPDFNFNLGIQMQFDSFSLAQPLGHSRCPSSQSAISTFSDSASGFDFDLFPQSYSATPSLSGNSHAASHTKRLIIITQAFENPNVTDENGRNGLHCLGSAITSLRTMKNEHDSLSLSPQRRRRKHSNASQSSVSPSTFSVSDFAESTLNSPNMYLAPPPSHHHHHHHHMDPDSVPTSPIDDAHFQSSKEDDSKECLEQRIEMTKNLIEAGVNVNACDWQGNTPLMAYVANSFEWSLDRQKPLDLIRTLISAGANIHARNRKGETALHVAARCGRKNAVRVLIDAGANIHARDGNGNSVYDILDRQFYSRQNSDKQVHVREIAQFHLIKSYIAKTTDAVQDPSVLDEWRMVTPKKAKRSSCPPKKRSLIAGEDSNGYADGEHVKKHKF